MTAYEIPLISSPQSLSVTLNGKTYNLLVRWNWVQRCWVLDIYDSNSVAVLLGVPLVTGLNLLEQFGYLGIGGQLIVQSDFNFDAVPTFNNLGSTGHLYFVV